MIDHLDKYDLETCTGKTGTEVIRPDLQMIANRQNEVDCKTLDAKVSTEVTEHDMGSDSLGDNSISFAGLKDGLQWRRSLGLATIAVLSITIPLSLAVLGFLSFLWYGPENSLWLTIMCRNWATRAVTIPSLLLRTCGDLQAGTASAMIAALVLEGSVISLPDAARWSIARASRPRPQTLLFPLFRGAGTKLDPTKLISMIAVLLLCATILVLQFSSTILLTDLGLGPLPGQMHGSSVLYNLVYPQRAEDYLDPMSWIHDVSDVQLYPLPNRIPTWSRNPPAYPAFAEYRRAVSTNHSIDDTGTLLRAFLPYSDTVSRQNLRSYTGKALVLDNRVSCQAPQLANLITSEFQGEAAYPSLSDPISRNYYSPVQINGTVAPTDRRVDRLWTPASDIPFSCVAGVGSNSTSICQLNILPADWSVLTWNSAGGLLSEFSNLTLEEAHHRENFNESVGQYISVPSFITWGTPLLVLRTIESGPLNLTRDPAFNTTLQPKTLHPIASTPGDSPWSTITEDVEWHPWKISASLCYTAWDIATLDVNMNSNTNRTEPLAHWTQEQHFYTIPNVTNQLLGSPGFSTEVFSDLEDRHMLRLQEQESWIPAPEDRAPKAAMPFVQAYADLSGDSLYPGYQMAANWTALLMKDYHRKTQFARMPTDLQTILADDTLIYLFDELMESSNNSIAQSVAALITVLSGMAYYDELPLFHAEANVTQALFTDVLFPQRVGGFWVVVIVVLLHNLLTVAVTVAFLLRSKMSFVGSYWHTVVQLLSEDTAMVFAHGSVHTDKDVRRHFSSTPRQSCVAKLVRDGKEMSAHIGVNARERDPDSRDCKTCFSLHEIR